MTANGNPYYREPRNEKSDAGISKQFLKITIIDVDKETGVVSMGIRVRGDNNWLYYECSASSGTNIIMHDDCDYNSAGIKTFPRGAGWDQFVELFA